MSEYSNLEPKLTWLQNRIDELRFHKPVWEGVTLNRFHAELTLYNVSSQTALQKVISESVNSQEELTARQVEQAERLQKTLERSIESQDKFSRNANFLAWGAFILVGVQIILGLLLRIG